MNAKTDMTHLRADDEFGAVHSAVSPNFGDVPVIADNDGNLQPLRSLRYL
jgi:hypothetical protein